MYIHRFLSIAPFIALAAAQGKCRFPNGTLLPDDPAWNIYQPCLAENGPVTTCCALARSNPPYGNISLEYTQDECLPNGVCMNRITSNEGERLTTWFIDYCTEGGQEDEATKCANVCSTGNQELTAKITPCDGTKNSTKWCCGGSTDCCSGDSNIKPVELAQILGAVSSSVVSGITSATSSATSIGSQASASGAASSAPTAANTQSSGPQGLRGGAIAGIVVGALVGLALVAAALFFARRASQKKKARYGPPPGTEHPQPVEAPAYSPGPERQEMSSTVKYAHVAEMPGPPPIELQGDAPAYAAKP
ncbi:hypothetical protein N0V87_008127 [Didymella glomerata]|uniref:Mid2 domain-containing protein n=1 Tax=Didymella glomerata TaxID=749621 RepID=A0A9W8WU85_9PLEO|nr:hypothetical protein N0V87_008127 [Didymella glomerata]